ncbi:eCIS core domain-containing protein [Streptomyces hiroshimensis]
MLNTPGRPLDPPVRHEMQARFAADFSRVRVHTDDGAARTTLGLQAAACTVGDHILFGAGRYRPGTADGRRVLAHELTHVLQQRSPGPGPREPLNASDPQDAGEREAEAVAERLLAPRRRSDLPGAGVTVSQRRPVLQRIAVEDSPRAVGAPHIVGIPFWINPDVFDFKPGPPGSNWQVTGCVTIIFGHGSLFRPMQRIKVGVKVWAPLTLRSNRALGVREAQRDSANAAEVAALRVKEFLDAGVLIPSEVQPKFVDYMRENLKIFDLGYRVQGCKPD